ncbi:putative tRNA pseudouridine synthase [Wickerhamomyces ciferrii]|uniref:tRNA pseudouridine synthase n=1 Tax=Wickerhamomyces ciferrii (strain ATCC 14091 / BCRC 22168 / CBS 111 / JCM 3599 / NBRC 0793 / NRRL Y-1031 F-60-10) TaxID=1206466 RepID=K0KSL0_WICCF|nr:putative tRNA pseudouridine synthase [Wickerhamomyces ciferrii]CCH45032.1 putative tRNA pseudouridine synthase [Wickerhamomyces ciferrii]
MSSETNSIGKYSDWSKEDLISRILELETPKNEQNGTIIKRDQKPQKKSKPFDFSKHHTRFIALKFSYLGWNYNGLAIQKEPTPLPTVEGTIIEALNKCKLIPSLNPGNFNFSRCGRTDKGVSALNQVISLKVRSNLTPEEQLDPNLDSKEFDYINILNGILPSDIKIHEISLRPPQGFDARFSCTSRHYKYLFHQQGLDIELMQKAAKLYEGSHDFRNFCKIDGSKQISNYERTILKSQILDLGNGLYCFDLEGSAFLWHQVRNMVAILFLVGQKLESPGIVTQLMNIQETPTRPLFDMGSDIPLILYDCKFPEMEWVKANKCAKYEKTLTSVYSQWIELNMKTQVAKFMYEKFVNDDDIFQNSNERRTRINLGDGKGKIVGEYVPLFKRDRMESFEVVNERWKKRKLNDKN